MESRACARAGPWTAARPMRREEAAMSPCARRVSCLCIGLFLFRLLQKEPDLCKRYATTISLLGINDLDRYSDRRRERAVAWLRRGCSLAGVCLYEMSQAACVTSPTF